LFSSGKLAIGGAIGGGAVNARTSKPRARRSAATVHEQTQDPPLKAQKFIAPTKALLFWM
jgi:hypothetical protein